MNHLFIDTSNSYCSINLCIKDDLVFTKFWESNNNHSEELYANFIKVTSGKIFKDFDLKKDFN